MWILVRLALAVVGYLFRHISRERQMSAFGEESSFRGEPYAADIDRGKKDQIRGFRIAKRRKSPTWIRMHREGWIDRLAKRLRLTREIQIEPSTRRFTSPAITRVSRCA
jgi:hypothetical protein